MPPSVAAAALVSPTGNVLAAPRCQRPAEDVRSVANAYGLMQIVPATGRQYARMLKLPRKFSISMGAWSGHPLHYSTSK